MAEQLHHTPSRRADRIEPEDLARQRQALHERAERLGATAHELEQALDALALKAEAVLHRLRGGRAH